MSKERRHPETGLPIGSTLGPLFWFYTGLMIGVALLVTGVVRK